MTQKKFLSLNVHIITHVHINHLYSIMVKTILKMIDLINVQW